MHALCKIILAVVAVSLQVTVQASAQTTLTVKPNKGDRLTSSYMITVGQTKQMIGHYEFCKKYPYECKSTPFTGPVKLIQSLMDRLNEVNTWVNDNIDPKTDLELYGKDEVWDYPEDAGDCEDYALLKRKILINEGWPASTLLLTTVHKPNGEGHAVLTVRVSNSGGAVDLILDNLNDRIFPWYKTPYRFVKRQSPHHAGRWEKLRDTRENYTASVD